MALLFTTSQYGDTASFAHGIGSGDFTFATWTRPTSITTAFRCLWSNGGFSPAIYECTTGTTAWGFFWGATARFNQVLSAGSWQHLAMRRIGTAVRGFYNGTEEAQQYTNSNSMATAVWRINHSNSGTSEVGDGRRAHMALWNVGLSNNEIASLYRGELPINIRPNNLLAYWPLWGHNSPEIDLSPNGLDVTLTGSPTKANDPLTKPYSLRFWGHSPDTYTITTEALVADIAAAATVSADLTEKTFLEAGISASAATVANLRLTTSRLEAAITASATVAANVTEHVESLSANIEAAGTLLNAILETNLEHASSTLSLTQEVTQLAVRAGNTIGVSHAVSVEIIVNPATTSTLALTQNASVIGDKNQFRLSQLDFQQSASWKHVLPTKTASSTLSLTQTVSEARLVQSTLSLTQTAVGTVFFLTGNTTSPLNLTQTVSFDAVITATATSLLQLLQEVTPGHVDPNSCTSNLVFNSIAYATLLEEDCYVVLQAPFHFLQTSIVIPCPLFGDTENLVSEMSLRRTMNGRTKTFIKTNKNRRLTYTFRLLDAPKAREVMEFFKYYNTDYIKLTNHKGEIWKVRLLTNPIDYVKTGRYKTDVALEFEGEKLYG